MHAHFLVSIYLVRNKVYAFSFFKFSGLLSILFIFLSFCLLNIKDGKGCIDVVSDTLCSYYFGHRSTNKIFGWIISIVGILQVNFFFYINNYFNFNTVNIATVILIVSLLGIILSSIVTYNVNPRLHNIFSIIGFICSWLSTLILHIMVYNLSVYIGLLGIVFSVVLALGGIITLIKYGLCAIPEVFFLIFLMMWNLTFSFVVI